MLGCYCWVSINSILAAKTLRSSWKQPKIIRSKTLAHGGWNSYQSEDSWLKKQQQYCDIDFRLKI